MTILLIGGTGVLSSAVCAEVMRKGISVTMINRGKRAIPDGVELIKADKDDTETICKALKGRCFDAVCDFLVYNLEELQRSFTLYSKFCKQYVFISSCAVTNSRVGGVLDEDSPKVLPEWKYSVDKWACEQALHKMSAEAGVPVTIVRPGVTYGDTRIPYGVYPQYMYHWTFAARILAGKPIIRWNNGVNRCNMTHVDDFAVGFVGLFGNPAAYGEAFAIVGDETPSFNEVLDAMSEYLGVKIKTVDVTSEFYAQEIPNRAGEILCGRSIDAKFSPAKIMKVVPEFKQTIHIKEGIFRTLDAYKAQNYQQGIDWFFDAQCDRIIAKWCRLNGISASGMNLGFVDYLGKATKSDKRTYISERYREHLLMRAKNKLKRIVRGLF